jgi:RNA polymerase sigma-70 factor, ECF subfamily
MQYSSVEEQRSVHISLEQPIASDGARPDGEPYAFSVLVERFGEEIYRYAWHLARNQVDADDLYQETLLKAFRAYTRLPADANHRAWLYKIASNTFISDLRKRGRDQPMTEMMEYQLADPTPDPVSGIDARDLLTEVERFVTELPPKQRMALVLRKYQNLGYDQIASALNSSEAAARANVHEALRKLRLQFADRLEV